MKAIELRLIAELMRNSRRSDRELAKILCVSEPTVTRIRKRLEKEGYIKEYTIIPDFSKLGYTIMGVTQAQLKEYHGESEWEDIRKKTSEVEKDNPHASLMAVNGLGSGKNRLFISFYENYTAYTKAMDLTKQLPYVDAKNIETFLVNLEDKTNYRLLSMTEIAKHLLKKNNI